MFYAVDVIILNLPSFIPSLILPVYTIFAIWYAWAGCKLNIWLVEFYTNNTVEITYTIFWNCSSCLRNSFFTLSKRSFASLINVLEYVLCSGCYYVKLTRNGFAHTVSLIKWTASWLKYCSTFIVYFSLRSCVVHTPALPFS